MDFLSSSNGLAFFSAECKTLTWLDLTWTLDLTPLRNTDLKAGHDLMHQTIAPLIVCLEVNIQTWNLDLICQVLQHLNTFVILINGSMRNAKNFLKMAFSMKLSYFCTHFVSLCCYNPSITIFTVVITHRGSFILYLMPIHCAIAWQTQQNDLCAQRSLRSAWASAQSDQRLRCVMDQTVIDADSEYSIQTERMLRLIWVFAGRTFTIVGFVMWRLIFVLISPKPQTFHCTSDNF